MFEDIKPHLSELRRRLAYSVAALGIMFVVAFIFSDPIMHWMEAPLQEILKTVSEKNGIPTDGKLITTQVGGVMFVTFKVAFLAGLLFAIPVILWQLWAFIAPGLYANEKKMVIPFVLGGSIMFTIGVLFAYYIVVPYGFEFLITFGYNANYVALITIEDYVGFFSKIMFGFAIAFELPVFAYFLALLGLITDRSMIAFFKYAIVIIFILAALLTPPDVITQLLMAMPLILLYGVSILIVKMVNPAEDEEDIEEETQETPERDGSVANT